MAFNYSINFATFSRLLLARNKRKPRILAFTRVMIAPIIYLYERYFDYYFTTANYVPFIYGTNYSKGEIVKYGYQAYESLVDDNVNTYPYESDYWVELQNNWIGARGRARVKGGLIPLEYYLNKFYGTGFAWPGSTSDIYIETNEVGVTDFVVTDVYPGTSVITNADISSVYYFTTTYAVPDDYDFTIYVPSSLWATLGSSDSEREASIKSLIDKYVPSGLRYNAESY